MTNLAANSVNFWKSVLIFNPSFSFSVFSRGLWLLWGTQAQVQETG